jgi:branched-chain amino acid transport system permease protein
MKPYRIPQWGWGILALLLLLLIPKILPEIKTHLTIEILIMGLYTLSFNLLYGYGGLLAFGFGALFGIGAYAAALVFSHLPGVPLLLALFIAAAASFAAGVVIGSLSVRLRGSYFALITFAFQMFLYAVALKWRAVTNGDDGIGITRPDLVLPFVGKVSMMNITNLYYLTLVIVALGILAAYLFLKTHLGNSVVCIRENENRSAFLGYNVFRIKVTIFAVAGFLAGVAGGLFVLFNEFVGINSIDMNISFAVVLMAIIGGTGHFLGPMLGAAFYIVFQDWVSSLTARWWLFVGAFYVLVVLYLRGGLISLFQSDKWNLFASRKGE